jgi:hypothetical protein
MRGKCKDCGRPIRGNRERCGRCAIGDYYMQANKKRSVLLRDRRDKELGPAIIEKAFIKASDRKLGPADTKK